VKVILWDGKTAGPWEEEVERADAVVNLAGEPLDARRWSRSQKDRIVRSRVDATGALVQAIKKAARRPAVLVSASGVGYYGPVDEGNVKEDSPRGSDFLSGVTSQWENAAHEAEGAGVRTVVLRTAVVLGEKGGALRKLLIPFRLFVGGPLGSGRQWFPWVHREDFVSIVLHVMKDPSLSGTFNAVAPEAVTMKAFCATLGTVLHRPSWAPVPAFVLKMALGEMSDMVLTGQRAIPFRLQQAGFKFKFPALDQALRDTLRKEKT
jgi:uncharacterized protein (TIGR01777 family)